MQLISEQMAGFQSKSSWIRKMFESGIEMKKIYGADKVYDFSLGSPDLPPPPSVIDALRSMADDVDKPAGLGYMPNAGFPGTREALAKWAAVEQQTPEITADDLLVTVGAAGGLNCLFRTILMPGDEVVCPAPYFVEYGFYCGNYGGVLKPVKSETDTFKLDIAGIKAAFTEKTRCLIINSPNNPSGVIYTEAELQELGKAVDEASEKFGHPIYLVADEPYRFLSFNGQPVPSVFKFCKYSIVISSFSKNLGLAGERVGFIAVNPAIENRASLVSGLIMANRILGYVNAPILGQKLIQACLANPQAAIDLQNKQLEVYRKRRDLMASILDEAGIKYRMPDGTFYFFPKAPDGMSDVDFVNKLQEHRILAVPGSGFGYPGYFRLALCCDETVIENSRESWIAAGK